MRLPSAILVRTLGSLLRLACHAQIPDDQRREQHDEAGIEGLEPGDGNLPIDEPGDQAAVGEVLREEADGVALLLIGRPEQAAGDEQQEQRDGRFPVAGGQRLFLFRVRLDARGAVLRQRAQREQIG